MTKHDSNYHDCICEHCLKSLFKIANNYKPGGWPFGKVCANCSQLKLSSQFKNKNSKQCLECENKERK